MLLVKRVLRNLLVMMSLLLHLDLSATIPVPSGYSSTRDFIEDTHGTPSDKKTVTEEFNPSGLSAKAWYDSRLTRVIQLLPKIPNEEPA